MKEPGEIPITLAHAEREEGRGKRGCRHATACAQVEGLAVCTGTRHGFYYLLFSHAVFTGSVLCNS